MDRRDFMQRSGNWLAAGLMANAWPLGIPIASAAQPQVKGLIDAHVHLWTDDLEHYPLAAGYDRQSMRPATFLPGQLFDHCRPEGVLRIVLIQMSYYGFDNSYMLDVIAAYPGVFVGVAAIDATQADVSARMKSLQNRGVTGFRLHPRESSAAFYETWLESDAIRTMFRVGSETGQAMCFLVNPNALPQIDRICERFPDTTVVIDHMARIGIDGTIRQADLDALFRCARHERTFVKISAFYALGKKRPPYTDLGDMVRKLRDAYGASRLMWASDCPFQVQGDHTYRDSIQLVQSQLDFLTNEDRDWLLRGTAEKVFFPS